MIISLAQLLLWVWLLVLIGRAFKRRSAPLSVPENQAGPEWSRVMLILGVLLVCLVATRSLAVGLVNEDDWLFMGYGRWVAHHWLEVGRLFTEFVHPTEPIVRIPPLLWYGLDHTLLGDNLVAWHMVTLAAHILTSGLVALLAARLLNHRGIALGIGLLYCFHPVQTEVLSWLSSGRENILMTALITTALLTHLRGRTIWTVFLAALAMLTKEHALSIIVILPAVDWIQGRKWQWRTYLSVLALVAAWLLWRMALMSSQNAEQSAYLADLIALPIIDMLALVFVDLPAQLIMPIVPGLWPFPAVFTGAITVLLGTLLWLVAQRADAVQFFKWTLFALIWLYATVGPSVGQMHLPEGPFTADRVPAWHFRILTIGMVGPLFTLGWALTHLDRKHWQFVVLVLTVTGALGLFQNLEPYVALSQRVDRLAHAVDSGEWNDKTAVRFVRAQDPALTFLLNRRQMSPNAKTLPVLVGEPRCGCVMLPVAVADAIMAPLRIEPVDPGDPCTCQKWREDAEYFNFDGQKLVAP
ncbi:MAG TPA: hypothetical protein EYN66_18430 [Myxococcales bacterium]|nr:hypothetical protein [Myxococcales bacterium]